MTIRLASVKRFNMKTTSILVLLTLTALGIWLTLTAGWLALTLYLLALTAVSFTLDVFVAARRIDDGKEQK